MRASCVGACIFSFVALSFVACRTSDAPRAPSEGPPPVVRSTPPVATSPDGTPSGAAPSGTASTGTGTASGANGAAPPASDEALERDLRDIAKDGAFPKRITPLGWTSDGRFVYRSLRCDADVGGGRGPYCDLDQCVASSAESELTNAPADRGRVLGECTSILTLDVGSDEARHRIDEDAVRRAAADHRASLGELSPGETLPPATLRAFSRGGRVFVRAPLGGRSVERLVFVPYADGHPSTVRDLAIDHAGRSPSGACVVGLGRFVVPSTYEGVPASFPLAFGTVFCEAGAARRTP